jgi:hypothetical protein
MAGARHGMACQGNGMGAAWHMWISLKCQVQLDPVFLSFSLEDRHSIDLFLSEYRTMDDVQKPSDPEPSVPPSDPFRKHCVV